MKDYIYLLNKPRGISSFKAIRDLKYSNKEIQKIGHAGTLDPMAEGLLITMINGATKYSDDLMHLDKIYEVVILLGYETDTLDLEGNIVFTSDNLLNNNYNEIIKSFIGRSIQIPPKYSAIKIEGKKLYELARNNVEVEIKGREVEIYEIKDIEYIEKEKVIKYQDDKYKIKNDLVIGGISFKARVSSGTYIRSLVRDIGRKLGIYATMCYLKRIKIGQYELEQTNTPIGLKNLYSLNKLKLDYNQIFKIINGQQLFINKQYGINEIISLEYNSNFIGHCIVVKKTDNGVYIKRYKYINKEIL